MTTMLHMTKYIISLALIAIFLFTGTDCKKNNGPIVPPDTTITPIDTTSQNFTWQTFTFGGNGGSSYFKDVAIINDSDIWAVGMINIDSTTYNAAHWDGKKWELRKIPYHDFGSTQPFVGVLNTVFAFSSNDIFISSSANLLHWDGNAWTEKAFFMRAIPFNGQVNKMWATNGKNIYCVGNGGAIYYYRDSSWTKQESGTTIDLRDVWGSADGKTVWVCGYSNDNSKSILLKYDGNSWQIMWSSNPIAPPYGGLITSLCGDKHLYLTGTDGIFRQNIAGNDSVVHLFSLTHFPYRIKVIAENNITMVGDAGMVQHYNGANWKELNLHSGQPLYSTTISQRMIIAVGVETSIGFGAALIYLGKQGQ
jgi:hypothetical protein